VKILVGYFAVDYSEIDQVKDAPASITLLVTCMDNSAEVSNTSGPKYNPMQKYWDLANEVLKDKCKGDCLKDCVVMNRVLLGDVAGASDTVAIFRNQNRVVAPLKKDDPKYNHEASLAKGMEDVFRKAHGECLKNKANETKQENETSAVTTQSTKMNDIKTWINGKFNDLKAALAKYRKFVNCSMAVLGITISVLNYLYFDDLKEQILTKIATALAGGVITAGKVLFYMYNLITIFIDISKTEKANELMFNYGKALNYIVKIVKTLATGKKKNKKH
jgi:hypothetical protein